MNKNKKYGMQLFAQTINRDNVTMYEQKDGTIPKKVQQVDFKRNHPWRQGNAACKIRKMDLGKEKEFRNTSQKDQELTG